MVSKRALLFICAIVWLAAGFNVTRLGVIEYVGRVSFWMVMLSINVFVPFFIMFRKMVIKNSERIEKMEERVLILKFFPVKSYVLIIVMMSFGIVLRNMEWVSRYFIAFFYTGLGIALFSAGVMYGGQLFQFGRRK